MKVLLTGAAGGLGSTTLHHLHEASVDVRATDIRANARAQVRIQVANLLQPENCYALMEDVEAVIHLANLPGPDHGTAQKVFGENITMNMNVLQAAREMGVRKVIFASSVQAYMGNRHFRDADAAPTSVRYLPLDGHHPATPGNPYALSKSMTEDMLRYFVKFQGIHSAVAVRFPRLGSLEWMARGLRAATTPPTIDPYTQLDCAFTWLTHSDAARLLLAIVRTELPGYRCYMPASPTPAINMSPREIIERFFRGVPLQKPIEQIDALWDISAITADTGWKPMDDLRDTR